MQDEYPDTLAQADERVDGELSCRLCNECIARREKDSPLCGMHTERVKRSIASDNFTINCVDFGAEELKLSTPSSPKYRSKQSNRR
jgi:hypothetical protein